MLFDATKTKEGHKLKKTIQVKIGAEVNKKKNISKQHL